MFMENCQATATTGSITCTSILGTQKLMITITAMEMLMATILLSWHTGHSPAIPGLASQEACASTHATAAKKNK
jgi:hypothetical protein